MYKIVIIAFFSLVLMSCKSSRKVSHSNLMKDAPGWVNQAPNQPLYYHGVGMSVKSINQDFRERARQNALSELAASISVNISSSSVLNQFEYDRTYSEFFRDNIRMSTEQFLEGYELVENWENDLQYWVYYRLSRSRFQQIKQERIRAALGLSVSKFEEARNLSGQGRVADALGFYIRSVEDIRNFLGEELKAEIDGEQKTYSTFLMANLMDQLQNIHFDFQMNQFAYKPGPNREVYPIEVIVRDEKGRPLPRVPVLVRYSWMPGHIEEFNTDSRGIFRIIPIGITPGKKSEHISCSVDIRKITSSTTSDVLVQRLFSSFNTKSYVLPVEIIPPVCFVSVASHNITANVHSIREEINNLLTQDGIEVTHDESYADFILTSEVSLINQSNMGNRYTKNIRASFIMKDHLGRIQFSGRADDVNGIGANYDQAWEDALRSLKGKIKINVYPLMIKDVFRKHQ